MVRQVAYRIREADASFAAQWDQALEDYADKLEREADRRAHDGLLKKKFLRNGDPVIDPETGQQYIEREYSDTLLIFRLKGLRPKVYRENIDHTSGGEKLEPIAFVRIGQSKRND
jgi:hypothetical protein